MRLSKVLSEEQRAVRFTGKKRKMEMERNGVLETGRSQQIKSTLDNLMGGTPPRKSVIRPRSELFLETLRVDQHRLDGEPMEDKRPPVAAKVSSTLGLVGEKERELIWKYIYQHKKFNHTTRVPCSEPHQNRPSVIVGHKHTGVEDLERAPVVDFHEISVPSFEDNLDELLDISKFNLQNPTIEMMYNLYFVDEAPLIVTLRNSFFANWRALPLGEVVMDDYIRFCKDKAANS